MLLRVELGLVEQRCDFCGATRSVTLANLRAGTETADPPSPLDPNIIEMPICTACGAKEFLNRVTATSDRPDAPTLSHRRAVNALHAALIAEDRVAPTLRAYFSTETVASDRAPLPWTFSHEPPPPVGRRDVDEPSAAAFAAFLTGTQDGD